MRATLACALAIAGCSGASPQQPALSSHHEAPPPVQRATPAPHIGWAEHRFALTGLPAGLHATTGVIKAGQVATTIVLSADAEAKLTAAAPLNVTGKGEGIERIANPEDRMKLIALMPHPDLVMKTETPEATVEAGGTVEITVSIAR